MSYDPHFSNVILLLPMEGENGSTTFTDLSPSARSVTNNSNVTITTEGSKWGTGSASFNGSNYFSFGENQDFNLNGLGTVEFWFKTSLNTGWTIPAYYGQYGSNEPWSVLYGSDKFYSTSTTFWSNTLNLQLDEWHHVALVGQGNESWFFLDGQIVGYRNNGNCFPNATSSLWVGTVPWDTPKTPFKMAGLRITKGVARYTAAFTVPTSPWPDHAQTFAVSGTAKFTDNTIATTVRCYSRSTGILLGEATPDEETGAFVITTDDNPCDITIFKDGYRPLTHGPVTPAESD